MNSADISFRPPGPVPGRQLNLTPDTSIALLPALCAAVSFHGQCQQIRRAKNPFSRAVSRSG
jgi:hypothetical protein